MQHLKIFLVEQSGPTVVVTPLGDPSSFRYRDLQAETNSLRTHIARPENVNLIVDLQHCEYFGSEFIGALVSLMRDVRSRKGRCAVCSANEPMRKVLQNMSLFRLWPYFEDREAALAAIAEPVA